MVANRISVERIDSTILLEKGSDWAEATSSPSREEGVNDAALSADADDQL